MNKGQRLYKLAKKLIPGGTQLLSKRPEMFLPELWPAYYKKAKGCEIWDLNDKKYTDMSYMGIGSCILGYTDEDVDQAVIKVIKEGTMSTLNAPEEVELAKLLIKLHPWAQMVRYARTGGEAMAIAVRIARAKSKKDLILFCGYHGWHDWYLSANLADDKALNGHLLHGLSPLGVPRSLKGSSFPFQYNDIESFLKLIHKYKNEIGVIVLESIRNVYPIKEFFETISNEAKKINAVVIVDEVSAGFRLNLGGAHLLFGLEPDIAVFAKGMSNGYPMAAIIGKKEVMKVAQDTFISSTYWTERIGPAAALTTIKKLIEKNVPKHIGDIGRKVQEGWRLLANKNNINIEISGIPPLGHFSFKYDNPLIIKTLFTQLMLEKKFLASTAFYASYAHKDQHVKKYLEATDETFNFISRAIKEKCPEKYLKGSICHSGFQRLT
ncbi:MAG: aminotransferase class III-fold pyridoxal phosphate-dependent enzyme [Actinobacteria bacterium]|nr:aminotransferase class III-fold pyridoxal phosphate-dependent enzyme [Actinomycetota bacterium]